MAPPTSLQRLVLIAGAGPAGLTLAHLLQAYRQPFVIIDPKTSGDHLSKATGLHRNTLRLFGKAGLASEVAQKAIELNGNRVYVNGALVKTTTFRQGREVNDKNLSINQFSLEEILLSRLPSSSVLFGKKVVAFDQNKEDVTVEVQDCSTGEMEKIRARYLIGADGAKSAIRKSMGSSFEGVTTTETAFTFDAVPCSPVNPNEMAMFLTESERLTVVPLPKGKCKFSGPITGIALKEE